MAGPDAAIQDGQHEDVSDFLRYHSPRTKALSSRCGRAQLRPIRPSLGYGRTLCHRGHTASGLLCQCVHCGLCVRYCAEVKKKNAVGFVDRGIRKEISFIPDIAAKECNDCKACFPLCPTSYLQAAFVLVESLAFPRDGKSEHRTIC